MAATHSHINAHGQFKATLSRDSSSTTTAPARQPLLPVRQWKRQWLLLPAF
jgi:hypothetical protein